MTFFFFELEPVLICRIDLHDLKGVNISRCKLIGGANRSCSVVMDIMTYACVQKGKFK